MIITVDEIEVAISQLEKTKSCGIDAIYAEHLLYCSRRLRVASHVYILFIHSWIPT